LVAVGATASLPLACSGQGDTGAGGTPAAQPPETRADGNVAMHLQIGPGVVLQSLSYTINGPHVSTGTLPIGDAQSIEDDIGGIQPGTGYTITLSGDDSHNDPCTGTSTPFAVQAGLTTFTIITVTCTEPADGSNLADVNTGVVALDAGVNLVTGAAYDCPGIESFSISPAELLAPQTSALSVTTIEAEAGSPGTPTVTWTTTGGTFVDTNGATSQLAAPTFSCGGFIGNATVTVTVGLTGSNNGIDAGNECAGQPFTSYSANIVCDAQCVTAANCTTPNATCAPATCNAGLCGFSFAPVGTACGTGEICNGSFSCTAPLFDVVRIGGSGVTFTAGETTPVFIDEYSPISGSLVGTLPALPVTANGANQPLTLIATDTTEGDLTTSADGRFLVMVGHADAVGTAPATGNGVGAFINAAGAISTSTLLTGAFVTSGIPRSAVSLDGSELWASGAASDSPNTGGVWFFGAADAHLVAGTTNISGRDLRIAEGQLYGDSSQPNFGLVGSGTPESGTQALTTLPGLPNAVTKAGASPWGFVFFDLLPSVPGVDTLYVADDRTSTGGGVTKFVASVTDGGTLAWTAKWNVMAPAVGDAGVGMGFRGLAGYATGTTVTLMGSTGTAMDTPNELAVIVDTGSGTPTPTMIAATGNEVFRGVAVPPHP
jgi:hypothetical protein